MTITRNGMTFELTNEEMIQAWMEVDKWGKIEDLEAAMPEEMSAAEKKELALKAYPIFEKAFSWNDSYFDNLQYALGEVGVEV